MARSTERDVDSVLDELRKDLHSARRMRMVTLIGGAILVVALGIIFWTTASQFRKNVRPDTLADVAAYTTQKMVKDARPAVEEAFKAKIPIFLRDLRVAFVKDVIPSLRKQIEKELTEAVQKTLQQSSQAFVIAARTVIARLKGSAEAGGKPTPEFLAALITREFEKEMNRRYAELPEETLGASFQKSKEMLTGLRGKLEALAKGQPKNREDALELRFIRAWVSLLAKGDVKQDTAPAQR